jgi:hypothetical protein
VALRAATGLALLLAHNWRLFHRVRAARSHSSHLFFAMATIHECSSNVIGKKFLTRFAWFEDYSYVGRPLPHILPYRVPHRLP